MDFSQYQKFSEDKPEQMSCEVFKEKIDEFLNSDKVDEVDLVALIEHSRQCKICSQYLLELIKRK